jgi:hypothetical protein
MVLINGSGQCIETWSIQVHRENEPFVDEVSMWGHIFFFGEGRIVSDI